MTGGHSGVPRRVWLLLGVMVLVWSFNFIVAKNALREFPPLLLGSLRFTVAGVLILPIYLWKRRGQTTDWRAAPAMVGIGLMGVGLNQLVFLVGLLRTSVAHSALIIGMTPVWVLLLSSWLGHERVSAGKLVGLAMSISGVAVLQLRSEGGAASLLGDFFVALTGMTFAIFAVGGKRLREQHDSLTLTAFAYAGSALVLAPVTLWQARSFDFGAVTTLGWAEVVYMAVFPSLVAYAIYYHALRYMAATRISMLAYLQPFLATFFAVPMLGEKITGPVLAGGAMVLIGVWWTERH